jgi:hypothetical protein
LRREEKRRAQKGAECLVRGEAPHERFLEVLDQEFQLRGTDIPFKISTCQLRGGTLLSGETKDDEVHRDSDARGVPKGILSKNVLGLVALR